jgi:hypothetical protein
MSEYQCKDHVEYMLQGKEALTVYAHRRSEIPQGRSRNWAEK